MMRKDLASARKAWLEEADDEKDAEVRENSSFLRYEDENGLFADFHANRHTFITNLSRVGVRPRTAQSLARHSDIRLTMGVYTHIGLLDQAQAIESLPAPPPLANSQTTVGISQNSGPNGHTGGQTSDRGQTPAAFYFSA